jgi:predicted RNA binding protein YcfA (HicA-like mRNA interferase family)
VSAKDVKHLIKTAKKQGWTISETRGNHLRWDAPGGGAPYFSSKTPSDVRAVRNMSRDLARRGLSL